MKEECNEYDVWVCWVNAKTSYRATLKGDRPDVAIKHLDTVVAPNRRSAIKTALAENERWKR